MVNSKWYSMRVISGQEKKIKEMIDLEVERSGWMDIILQVVVPTEKVYKIRGGKKVIIERNILPGYLLVEADPEKFSGEIIQTITGMPNVIHFLGGTNTTPMRKSEEKRMLGKYVETMIADQVMYDPFLEGETVKIIDGPFNDFVGDVI